MNITSIHLFVVYSFAVASNMLVANRSESTSWQTLVSRDKWQSYQTQVALHLILMKKSMHPNREVRVQAAAMVDIFCYVRMQVSKVSWPCTGLTRHFLPEAIFRSRNQYNKNNNNNNKRLPKGKCLQNLRLDYGRLLFDTRCLKNRSETIKTRKTHYKRVRIRRIWWDGVQNKWEGMPLGPNHSPKAREGQMKVGMIDVRKLCKKRVFNNNRQTL
jgi:hypothetical protein